MRHTGKREQVYNYITSIDVDSLTLKYCKKIDHKSDIWIFEGHSHNFMELIFFLEGRVKIETNGKDYDIGFNDIIVYPENVYHKEYLDMKYHHEVICLGVYVNSDTKLDRSFQVSYDNGVLRWLFNQINIEMQKKSEGYNKIINAYLKSILLNILRFYKDNKDEKIDAFKKSKIFIQENLSKDINVQNIASNVYVSPSYLTRLFNRNIGISPMRYVNELRIEAAKKLLHSNHNVSETSQILGFSESKYFSKVFKKIVGIPPSKYKRSKRNFI